MMNFMSGKPGFSEDYEMTVSRGMSSASSSSLHQFTYHQHDGGAQLPDYSTDINGNEDSQDRRGSCSAAAQPVIEREHMFDKVVTPSDVGKLNRLVIPKQHAEKYFPLDSSSNEKGLLLNFEDRNGKPWRFRYSYWNSSQSYVMTKGWSRFVKEKKLDAGDIVSFQRGTGEVGKDRLFIDWRRRPDAPEFPGHIPTLSLPHQFSFHSSLHPWNHPLFLQSPPSREYSHFLQANAAMTAQHHHHHYPYNTTSHHVVNGNPCPPGSIVYLRSSPGASVGGAGSVGVFSPQQIGLIQSQRSSNPEIDRLVFESVPVVHGKAAAKRLRLFGVNMDCPISESDECDILSHSSMPLQLLPHHLPPFHTSSSSSYSTTPSPHLTPPSYDHSDDKGKGSMSLDLDI